MSHPNALVNDVAKKGFGTGTNELYDKARPSYQKEVLNKVLDAVTTKSNVNIIEIGAGTGIFTRALLADSDWSNALAELRAVEPSEGMRGVFTNTISDARVSVHEGTFDSTGIPDGWGDLIVVAQAFHWCPNYETAIQEFARILKPTGVVALVWNLEDRDKAAWVAQLRETYEAYELGAPQFHRGLWRQAFSVPSYPSLFQEPIILDGEIKYVLPATAESVEERVFSKSYIAILPEEEKDKLRERVRAIVEKGDDKIWIDEQEGVFEYPYSSTAVFMKRK